MNGPHTPVFTRVNSFTRLIDRVGLQNAQEGKAAGRTVEQMGMNSTPVISAARVRRMNAEEARRTDFVPDPEDPRLTMHANARAAALGITNDETPDDIPGDIGHVSGDMSDAEIDRMLAAAKGTAVPGADAASEGAAASRPTTVGPQATGRVTLPRGVAAPVAGLAGPRTMPNFSNVEGFDLTRKVAVVDGMEFKLADEDVVAMKKYAIQIVLDNVTFQLAHALVALGIPEEMARATADTMRQTALTEATNVKSETAGAAATPGGMDGTAGAAQTVPQVRRGEDGKSLPPGQSKPGQDGKPMPSMHGDLQYLLIEEGSSPEVPTVNQGSSEQPASPSLNGRETDDAGSLLGDSEVTPT
jgi:hypothetical protein